MNHAVDEQTDVCAIGQGIVIEIAGAEVEQDIDAAVDIGDGDFGAAVGIEVAGGEAAR